MGSDYGRWNSMGLNKAFCSRGVYYSRTLNGLLEYWYISMDLA
jgi:hypothetical protein